MMTESSNDNKRGIKWLLREIFDLFSFAVLALGILLFVRFFVINVFNVVGASMMPTFFEKDFILVDKVSIHLNNYDRGDIIIFIPPGQDRPYIKRIIGLPGETIKIEKGNVFICTTPDACKEMNENYLPIGTETFANCNQNEFEAHDGFIVFGDNRGASTDSRCCFNGIGCYEGSSYSVPEENIIGKVFLKIYPQFKLFKT